MANVPIVEGGKYRIGPKPSSQWVEVIHIGGNNSYVIYRGVDEHKITEYFAPMWKFQSIINAFVEGEE